MQRITRKAAKAAGLKYYFTGKPCKRGHIDKRFVSSFRCMTCGREKALEAFRSLTGEKREALRNYNRRRWQDPAFRKWAENYRKEHASESATYRKSRKETHPDYFREYYAKYREQRKLDANKWHHANAERAGEQRKVYVSANRDKARIWGRKAANKRWAIKKQLFVEDVDPLVVFARDKGVCGICGKPVEMNSNWELDHIVPLSKRGPHSYANVQLAHMKCNRSKGNRVA
jgi:5-methylcytosine-specific restriction endonuclease McrA